MKEKIMKRLLAGLMMAVGLLSVMPAEAHWHGGYYGGWHTGWVAPAIAGAVLGTAVYAATAPHYVMSAPPVVVAPPAPRTAYFCPTSQQYYPNAPACNVPWQVVGY
jgi:hypothetical protein